MLRSNCWWVSLSDVDIGHADRLQPAQHAELGVGITQPVEDHHANGVLDRGGEAGAAKDRGQRIEAQLVPQASRAQTSPSARADSKRTWGASRVTGRAALGTQQTAQQGVKLPAALVDTPERGDRALAGLAVFVAKGLDQLRVAVTAGGGDLDEHALEYSADKRYKTTLQ